MAEGFLGRWSQRKAAVRAGQEPVEPVPQPSVPKTADDPVRANLTSTAPAMPAAAMPTPDAPTPAPAAPTLEDAQALKSDSDFKPFAARGVDPAVRNVAMKKLFADPHFNVMDGLDTYIDDYSQPTALLPADLRKMASAQFLKLFDDETPEAVDPPPTGLAHAHSDLQLQQDTPAEPAGPGERTQ